MEAKPQREEKQGVIPQQDSRSLTGEVTGTVMSSRPSRPAGASLTSGETRTSPLPPVTSSGEQVQIADSVPPFPSSSQDRSSPGGSGGSGSDASEKDPHKKRSRTGDEATSSKPSKKKKKDRKNLRKGKWTVRLIQVAFHFSCAFTLSCFSTFCGIISFPRTRWKRKTTPLASFITLVLVF